MSSLSHPTRPESRRKLAVVQRGEQHEVRRRLSISNCSKLLLAPVQDP